MSLHDWGWLMRVSLKAEAEQLQKDWIAAVRGQEGGRTDLLYIVYSHEWNGERVPPAVASYWGD